MDSLKTWLVEVVFKKISPQVMASLMTYVVAFLMAHQDLLEKMGITYYGNFTGTWSGSMPTGQILVVEFDTLKVYGAALLVAGVAGLWSLIQHHGTAIVKGEPQSGDMRKIEPIDPVLNGDRKDDPK